MGAAWIQSKIWSKACVRKTVRIRHRLYNTAPQVRGANK